MSEIEQITSQSTLGDLPLHDVCVNHQVLGRVVADLFEQNPKLPGILIEDEAGTLNLLSRRRFHERMSSPYGLELFLNRPIATFLDMQKHQNQSLEVLVLPHTESIEAAVQYGLQRTIENIYDPIIVVFKNDNLPVFEVRQLLDFHTLLLCQSRVMALANAEIQSKQAETDRYLQKYRQQQAKVQDYTKRLQEQQKIIQERNQSLEVLQAELIEKYGKIDELNRQFLEVGNLLSSEVTKVFQATFAGVNSICRSADRVVYAGELLEKDVNILNQISDSIAKVSRLAHHLSIKASILVNKSGLSTSGFSTVSEEISHLLSGTFEASKKITQVSDQFKTRISEVTQAAQDGTNVARSLISEMSEAQMALNQLESLVHRYHPEGKRTALSPIVPSSPKPQAYRHLAQSSAEPKEQVG